MATLNITVCDKCHAMDKPTLPYTIDGDGKSVTLDLCKEDAAVLKEYQRLGGAATSQPSATRTARKRRATPVATIEEIEAMKRDGQA